MSFAAGVVQVHDAVVAEDDVFVPAFAVMSSFPTPPRMMFEPPFEMIMSRAPVAAVVSLD